MIHPCLSSGAFAVMLSIVTLQAANPAITNVLTADPAAVVVKDTVYL